MSLEVPGAQRLTIGLVQIGNSFAGACYFPYSVGVLQAYVQAYSPDASRYHFLPILYQRCSVRDAAHALRGAAVVAFSVYVWNHNISLAIAREIKAQSPETLIVFGGPHVPNDAREYLRAKTFIDIACHGEGERTFLAVLEALPKRPGGFSHIPSLSWREDGRFHSTARGDRIRHLGDIPSPYLSGIFEPLIAASTDHSWLGVWETNRGCPFSCAYCDWGSANASKVYLFPLARLEQEIEWFAAHKVEFIFCCDGNFGMFPRDMDIARMAAEVKKRHGYPQALSVQNTKNASETAFQLQMILSRAGLNKGVTLALQSVNPEALRDVGRKNISCQAFHDLQRRFREEGVETYTDLILALPGETYESFARGVSEIITGGQHNRIQFINLSILPNAQMGDPAYREKHGMVTVQSRIINIHGAKAAEEEIPEIQILVVGTRTMPPDQWRRTRVFSWLTALLYFDKLLQIPMLLLQAETRTPCHELIEAFMDPSEAEYPVLFEMWDFFSKQAAVVAAGGEEYFQGPGCLNIYWPHDEYQMIRYARDGRLEAFYEEAGRLLARTLWERHGLAVPFLNDALTLNRSLLRLPFQDSDLSLELEHDVHEAYLQALRGHFTGVASRTSRYVIDRTSNRWTSWEEWMREVVWYGNKKGDYLYTVAAEA